MSTLLYDADGTTGRWVTRRRRVTLYPKRPSPASYDEGLRASFPLAYEKPRRRPIQWLGIRIAVGFWLAVVAMMAEQWSR